MTTVHALHALACGVVLTLAGLSPALASQDTDLAGISADVAFVRQYDGVLHVGIVLHNPTEKEVAGHTALDYAELVVIDGKANKKHFALKDSDGHYLAGPISDWNGGGRWFPKLGAKSDTLVWALFDAVAAGNEVGVQGPVVHAFDRLTPSEGPPETGGTAASSVPPLRASVTAAERADGQLHVRLKIVNPQQVRVGSHTLAYRDVYALDPRGKRSYPLLKDAQGMFLASPIADKNEGGRWFLSKVEPGGQALLDLTFQAPPDSVESVDVVVPWFGPLEAVAISGKGGAAASGIAVAGQSSELTRVLKELNADVTPENVKVSLAADLLFDFDKADLKPAAAPELEKVATVLKAYPGAQVWIDGHADGKGNDAYNQALSERRAAAVAQWLSTHAGLNGRDVHARGFGKTRPIAPNTRPDGSDDPDGRANNRRVEITVTKP